MFAGGRSKPSKLQKQEKVKVCEDNETNLLGPEEEDEADFALPVKKVPKVETSKYSMSVQQPQLFKSESEQLHKLIKELNEQALGNLYDNTM